MPIASFHNDNFFIKQSIEDTLDMSGVNSNWKFSKYSMNWNSYIVIYGTNRKIESYYKWDIKILSEKEDFKSYKLISSYIN